MPAASPENNSLLSIVHATVEECSRPHTSRLVCSVVHNLITQNTRALSISFSPSYFIKPLSKLFFVHILCVSHNKQCFGTVNITVDS